MQNVLKTDHTGFGTSMKFTKTSTKNIPILVNTIQLMKLLYNSDDGTAVGFACVTCLTARHQRKLQSANFT